MALDFTKQYRKLNNYQVLIVFLFGYVATIYLSIFFKSAGISFPYTIICVLYYSVFSLFFKKYGYSLFLALSLVFFTTYFAIVNCQSSPLSCLLTNLSSFKFPILAYSFLLIPISFLGISLDYFALAKELRRLFKVPFLGYLIAILIKKELIEHRFNAIMEAFYTRGLNTKSTWGRYRYLTYWVIPLVVTTLMEGLESHDYNVMLRTNVKYLHKAIPVQSNPIRIGFIVAIVMIIIIGIIIWKSL